jgi:hypothetical protein
MNLPPISKPGATPIDAGDNSDRRAAEMSVEQLLHLGTHQVVYLKSGMLDGERVFVLSGADGSHTVAVDAVETAVEMTAEHGLDFVTVH